MALTTHRPIPGMLKIVSRTTLPLTMIPSRRPTTVSTGISAFFRECLRMMTRSLSPLAQAVRT